MKFKITTYYAFWIGLTSLIVFIILLLQKPIQIFKTILFGALLIISIIDLIFNCINCKKYKGIDLNGKDDC